MRVWMMHLGEDVHSDGPEARLYRLGALAEVLGGRGHDVERWAPTFSHNTLRQRFDRDQDVHVSDRYTVRHIYADGFVRHRSPARLRFHRTVARRWVELGRQAQERPDVILTSIPTPEIAAAGIELGREHAAPVVVDVRDLWPDVYATMLPRAARPLATRALEPARSGVRRSVRSASSVVAVSRTYLDWALDLAGRREGIMDRVFPLSYRPPAVDESRVQAAAERWAARLSRARTVCLFLGTFTRFFALDDVVDAARVLEQRRPGQVVWVLAGDGPTWRRVAARARHTPSVTLPGRVGAAEAVALLRLAHVGLAPYGDDAPQSLPNKPFEYAWAGLPILSSLRGELEDLVERRAMGRTYRCGDPEALAASVESMLVDPVSRRRSGAAARSYWQSVEPESVYGGFADHLEAVASTHGSRRAG